MQFGLFGGARTSRTGPQADSTGYGDFIAYVKQAERLGFGHVFLVEHHFTGYGQLSATLTLLSYLAACTTRIRLGTAGTVLPWHNPVLLAEQVARFHPELVVLVDEAVAPFRPIKPDPVLVLAGGAVM